MWPVWIQLAFYCLFFFYLFVLRGRQPALSPAVQRRQSRIAAGICAASLAVSVVLWSQLLTRKPTVPLAAPVKAVPVAAASPAAVASPASQPGD